MIGPKIGPSSSGTPMTPTARPTRRGAGGIQVLIPPDSGKRKGERPGWTGGRYSPMRRVLATDLGKQLYRKRQ
ncbi:MAG TPA: hypothetical protein VGI55_04380 [Solirubrobacteraceae bacterium]|jgi:hypothetical protein